MRVACPASPAKALPHREKPSPPCGWAKELLGVSPAGGRNQKGSLHTDVLSDFRRAAACLGLVSPPSSEGCADPDSTAKRQDSVSISGRQRH